MKEIEVDCPCCEARILIDVRTKTVLRHTPKASLNEFGRPDGGTGAWDRAHARVSARKGRGTDAFDDALAREQSREKNFDDLFEKAKAKVDGKKKALDGDESDA
ncbi:hypothetical protein Poly30_08400 [Planctomycetes bacterium Poly30]|uniref:Uncharacterized protein n=1 Tax=Saltatorellus ferox TaxID=2528018 RepID=A0A518EMN3_9BACT|nr:hypothetical protein Poly30_08400 [Planctomycetes bacterium Poly30]